MAHVKAVAKKYSSLKQMFPEARISIFVTEAAMASAGISSEQAEVKIKEILSDYKVDLTAGVSVTIPESALGEHYVEFVKSGGRFQGEASVSGLRVSA